MIAVNSGMQGEKWKHTTVQTALLFPGVIFSIFFVLNLMIWGQHSSGAAPFGTLFALCFLWFGISVPLVFIGSYFGYKKPTPDDPVRTNKIPRQIPEQAWYMHPVRNPSSSVPSGSSGLKGFAVLHAPLNGYGCCPVFL